MMLLCGALSVAELPRAVARTGHSHLLFIKMILNFLAVQQSITVLAIQNLGHTLLSSSTTLSGNILPVYRKYDSGPQSNL